MTPLGPTDRAALLGIARAAVLAHLGRGPAASLPSAGPLAEPRAAFVSVHVGGELRGCIGTFAADRPLAETVARVAVQAASEDPRFRPLAAADLDALVVSVSALGPPRPVPAVEDRPALRVGEQGLLVRRGWHRGALLPKVAVEQGWSAKEFLKHACLKAGLHARAWEEAETEVLVFEAEEFSEGAA
ncbi:MAG: AmmeMemoRadiSam system protein A [Anaeromyxobacter sp.]